MSFEIRNKLMMLCSDSLVAFGIAQEFVSDNDEKYTVYERCYNQLRAQGQNQPEAISSLAKDKASELWKAYETE